MQNLTAFALKNLLLTAQLLFTFTTVHATTYYFSSSGGADSRSSLQAQYAATPWRSLQKLNEIFNSLRPGDSILFKRDDIFQGSVNVTASGTAASSIVLAAYGNGQSAPVISGFTTLTAWSAAGSGIWESPVPPGMTMIRSVLVDGAPEPIGRYPNTDPHGGGYLTIDDVPAGDAITGPHAATSPNWTGADVVIRKNHWVLDRNRITGGSGQTLQYISESGYGAAKNYGYFIQNHPGTLDQACEWYFRNNKLGMFFGQQGPSGSIVEASTTERLVNINAQSYLVFNGLTFKGANEYAFDVANANHLELKNCSILYTGNSAVHITQSQHVWIENVTINYTNNIACDISQTSNLVLKNNTITNTGTVAGSGKGDSGSYEALMLSGDNQLIEGNTISNTGYIPVTFSGSQVTIRQNFISGFGFVKDDGGGIYTWNNTGNPPVHVDRLIENNIILDGLGAPDGTEDKKNLVHGIYMDDNADHVTIRNNTVARCGQYGIFIHNAHDLVLDGNTAFDNQAQVAMLHDAIAAQAPIRNISSTNNIFFSKKIAQPVALFKSIENDLADMGNMDLNYYCRPLDEQTPIDASWKQGWGFYELEGWQQLYYKDQHSKKTPATIAPYSITALSGSNMYSNGSFSSNINGLYAFAAAGNCVASWSSSSPLDAGALKLVFSSVSGNKGHASVIIGVGAIKAGQQYILRYEVAGAAKNKYIEGYLRKSLSPYNDLSERKLSRVKDTRTRCEVLFTASAAESNASIGLDVEEQEGPLYIDNIQLYEAQATITSPDDSIRFVYNKTTTPASYTLDGSYIDVKSNLYQGSISLQPFSSAILIKKNGALTTLPARFSSLEGIKKEQQVILYWTLVNTEPGGTQQVERSADGRQFEKIGEVTVSNTAITNNYSFTDAMPGVNNYYRIRYQEGSSSVANYSTIIALNFSLPGSIAPKEKVRISPNPATDQLQVSLDAASFSAGTAILKTIAGSTLRAVPLQGPLTIIDVSFLKRGVYLISIITGKGMISQRFIKE